MKMLTTASLKIMLREAEKTGLPVIFSGYDFGEISLVGFDFSRATFNKCEMNYCDASECSFAEALFKNCELCNVKLQLCNFERAVFKSCMMHDANFAEANLARAKFLDCDLLKSNFTKADLTDAKFKETGFSHSTMLNLTVSKKTAFKTCDFTGTIISGVSQDHKAFDESFGLMTAKFQDG